jgi:hypothetical protein
MDVYGCNSLQKGAQGVSNAVVHDNLTKPYVEKQVYDFEFKKVAYKQQH